MLSLHHYGCDVRQHPEGEVEDGNIFSIAIGRARNNCVELMLIQIGTDVREQSEDGSITKIALIARARRPLARQPSQYTKAVSSEKDCDYKLSGIGVAELMA